MAGILQHKVFGAGLSGGGELPGAGAHGGLGRLRLLQSLATTNNAAVIARFLSPSFDFMGTVPDVLCYLIHFSQGPSNTGQYVVLVY